MASKASSLNSIIIITIMIVIIIIIIIIIIHPIVTWSIALLRVPGSLLVFFFYFYFEFSFVPCDNYLFSDWLP